MAVGHGPLFSKLDMYYRLRLSYSFYYTVYFKLSYIISSWSIWCLKCIEERHELSRPMKISPSSDNSRPCWIVELHTKVCWEFIFGHPMPSPVTVNNVLKTVLNSELQTRLKNSFFPEMKKNISREFWEKRNTWGQRGPMCFKPPN